MVETDGLSISQGRDRGEAAFLGESSFNPIAAARLAGMEMKQQKLQEQKQMEEDAALLSDGVKAQWDTDVFNYFEPKIKELKTSIIDRFKTTGGKLSPLERMQFKQAWDGLKSEALVSNATYKAYEDQVKLLSSDKSGAYNREESARNLAILKNPLLDPKAKEEVEMKYKGNVMKWRADNAEKYGLVPSFSEDKYYQSLTKDETPETYQKRDEKGKLIYEKLQNGQLGFYEGKRLSDKQLNRLTDRIWSGGDWQDQQAKQTAMSGVDRLFSVNQNGLVGIPQDLSPEEQKFANDIFKRAGGLKGVTSVDEAKRRLARAYTAEQISARRGEGEQLRTLAKDSSGSSGRGGDGFDDNYTVTETPYTKTKPSGFNFNYPWNFNKEQKTPNRRIAIERTGKGGDTESLQLNVAGKQVRPIAFNVNDESGEVEMVASVNEKVGYDKILEKDIYEQRPSTVPLDQETWANVAAHYGFGGAKGVDNFKKKVLKMQDKPQPKKTEPTKTKKKIIY
jgi:hypothetical protein